MSPEQKRLYHKVGENKYVYRPYYHGGPKGLSVIAPATYTLNQRTKDIVELKYRDDKVYITKDYSYALLYATRYDGCVYEVVPVGRIEADDSLPEQALAFMCDFAEIVRVVE